jgi:DNA invertase Pin-like site-specific DNA recombinase
MNLGYARVSTEEQHLDLQLDDLTRAGIRPEDIKVEKRSGAKTLTVLKRTTALLQQGDSLTVWKLDRLGRTVIAVLSTIRELVERGVTVRSLKDSVVIDPSSAMGKFQLTLIAAQAELERDMIIERTKAGMAAAKARGKFTGGPRLYGFAKQPDEHGKFPIVQQEADVLKDVADKLLSGKSMGWIVKQLRERDIRTARGGTWQVTSLRRVLINPRSEAILGTKQYQDVLGVFADPKYRKTLGPPSEHLLSGIVRCQCGQRMYVSARKGGKSRYTCYSNVAVGNCGQVHVAAHLLEDYVTRETIKWLAGPGLAKVRQRIMAQDADLAAISAKIHTDERLLEEAARQAGEEGTPFAQLRAYAKPIEDRIRANRERLRRAPGLAALQDIPTTRKALEAAWPTWDMDKKRSVLKASIARLVISPTSSRGPVPFDERRVDLRMVSHHPQFWPAWATEEESGVLLDQVARDLDQD